MISKFVESSIKSAEQYYEYLTDANKGIVEVKVVSKKNNGQDYFLKTRTEIIGFTDVTIEVKEYTYTKDDVEIMSYDEIDRVLHIKVLSKKLEEELENCSLKEIKIISDLRFLVRNVRDWYKFNGEKIALPTINNAKLINGGDNCSDQQKEAIEVIAQSEFSYVFGPPGTGKTQFVLAQSIRSLVEKEKYVLLVAPTNTALEQIIRGIHKANPENFESLNILRLGMPSKRFLKDFAQICEFRYSKKESTAKSFSESKILACTIDKYIANVKTGDEKAFRDGYYFINPNHIFMDEAGYTSLIKAVTLFTSDCPKTFLGDHMQLPPVCEMSNDEIRFADNKLISLFAQSALFVEDAFRLGTAEILDRYLNYSEPFFEVLKKTDLTKSYRFSNKLAKILDNSIYKNGFKSAKVKDDFEIEILDCSYVKGENKRENLAEALAIKEYVKMNLNEDDNFMILTPYVNQLNLINSSMPELEDRKTSTIHTSQGKEWDTVIISVSDIFNMYLTDTNNKRSGGKFVINTAVSRAKKKLIIACDMKYWSRQKRQLITDIVNLESNINYDFDESKELSKEIEVNSLSFSCTYTEKIQNFTIQNIKGNEFYGDNYSYYSVIKNILQRGHNTKPSKYIENTLNDMERITKTTNVKNEEYSLKVKYNIILRYQMLLIELLCRNIITLEEKVVFTLINEKDEDLFRIAYNDIALWMSHLYKLSSKDLKLGQLIFDSGGIKIDADIFEFEKADIIKKDTIYIRNSKDENSDFFAVQLSEKIHYNVIMEGEDRNVNSLIFVMENLFGYSEFNDGQLPIISRALTMADTVGILPTGSGKSLCYQICCLLQPSINFVISPIVSLMYDQKENLDEFGITRTNFIESSQSSEQKDKVLDDFEKCKYSIIWISPERFQMESFRKKLSSISNDCGFAYAVIDEVHCMSEWGHDFRTSYLNLTNTISKYCGDIALIGLTATASQFVLEDIKNEFNIDSQAIKTGINMDRQELKFHVLKVDTEEKFETTLDIIEYVGSKYGKDILVPNGDESKCGVIFTTNKGGKKGCIRLAEEIEKEYGAYGSARSYHGDLGAKKFDVQKAFKENEFTLLTATKAFGMGVNKRNVRYTIHYGLPWSLEAFYQEAGRAGRDRQEADCFIIYSAESSDSSADELFDINANYDRVVEISDKLNADLSNIMYLWSLSNGSNEEYLKEMRWVMKELYTNGNNYIRCDRTHKFSIVQKAIYKLSLLNLIEDWVIEKWSETNGVFKVFVTEYTVETTERALLQYIRKYDANFMKAGFEERYEKYINIFNDSSINKYIQCMKIILEWTYENITYSRLQMIGNMVDLCERFEDTQQMQEYVNNYFTFTDNTLKFDNIAYNPDKYHLWFKVFYDVKRSTEFDNDINLIEKSSVNDQLTSLRRYLESYRYNTGLNFLYGVFSAITKEDIGERFQEAIEDIKKMDIDSQKAILEECYKIKDLFDASTSEEFGSYLAHNFESESREIHKHYKNNISEAIEIEEKIIKINKIKGDLLCMIKKD